MTTQKTYTAAGKYFYVYSAKSSPSGYGHYKITVELIEEFTGEAKSFNAVTNFMPGYDAANELDGQDKAEALYELIDNKIEDEIADWMEQI